MAIVKQRGPASAGDAINRALDHFRFVSTAPSEDDHLGGAVPNLFRSGSRNWSVPIQVFTMDVHDIIRGLPLAMAAKPAGWRYVIKSNGVPSALADLKSDEKNKAKFGRINTGPVVFQLYKACEIATALFDERDSEEYSVRLIEVPPLNVQALWLHGPEHDHFVPYWPTKREGSVGVEPGFLGELLIKANNRVKSIQENI